MRSDPPISRQPLLVVAALLALYFVWGSTYLAMRVAIDSFPPFMMAGLRYLIAGSLMYCLLRLRGTPAPDGVQWAGALAIGGLLLLGGNGCVAYAQQWVATGLAAVAIATVPLWTVIFSTLWGKSSTRREWLGISLGLAGVALLNLGDNMRASPLRAALPLFAAASWSFGSVWSKYLRLPDGLMGSATQMLGGGVLLLLWSLFLGEKLTSAPAIKPLIAMAYLIVFGSFLAFSAYLFLLKTVRPALATSYAYVNPLIAIWLGMTFLGERITPLEFAAMPLILGAVVLVMVKQSND
jgi:drug/metabolite transporter (DMT)-like permease